MGLADIFGRQLLPWSLSFSVVSGGIGLLVGFLYVQIRDRTGEIARVRDYNQLIMNSMAEGMLAIDRDYKVVMANRAFLEIVGFPLEEVIGRPCYEVSHGFEQPCRHPTDLCPLDTILSTGRPVSTIHRHTGRDRRPIYFEITASPVRDRAGNTIQIIEVLRDITERVKMEEALRDNERQSRRLTQEFNVILNTIPDVMTVHDPDLRIRWANRSAQEEFGRRHAEWQGRYCYNLWHGADQPCSRCPVIRSFQTGEPQNESVLTADQRLWDLRAVPLRDEDGKLTGVIEVARDVTDHRKLEEQLRQSQKMEAVGQLAGGVAHDFNNILTAVIGYGNILMMKMAADDPLRSNVEQILSAAEKAARLTHSLLAYSRKQIINLKPVSVNETVNDVLKLLLRIIGEDIELKTELSQEDLIVLADSGQIGQVLINLAANARDAMPQGGVLTITTWAAELKDHEQSAPGQYAAIEVADTGAGMSKEIVEKIFDPFFTTKEPGKGTGLGLAIVYGIVKQHNGYVTVKSEEGQGSTFTIYLPAALLAPTAVREEKPEPPPGGSETILVAEDDAGVRNLTRDLLSDLGYKVILAEDGEEAVDVFAKHRDEIDLVILDVIMPKKNGQEAYEAMTALAPGFKVLFTSGYAADIIKSRAAFEQGVNFLKKPVSPLELLTTVRRILDRRS